jgi:hypothetical protein
MTDCDPVKTCPVAQPMLEKSPLDRPGLLRIDSELKLLALHSSEQPDYALKMVRLLAGEIRYIPDSHLRSLFDVRLARAYMAVSRTEATEWLASLPSKEKEHSYDDYKGQAYSEAVAAALDLPQVQVQLISAGFKTGAFQIPEFAVLLPRMRVQDPGDATALFSQALAAFPVDSPSDQDVGFLLQLTRLMVDLSRENARIAVKLMMDALKNPALQKLPQPAVPRAQVREALADSALHKQVAKLAEILDVSDDDSTNIRSKSPAPPTTLPRPGNSPPTSGTSTTISADGLHRSVEFVNATKGLAVSPSDEDILRLATSITNRADRAQFYVLVLRRLQAKPVSITHLAKDILGSFDGSDDPALSLTAPRIVFHAAVAVNDPPMAQFAIISFAQGAAVTCKAALTDQAAAFEKGSACLAGYDQLATEIAKSPLRAALQVADPSLIQRLRLYDEQTCDPPTTRDDNPEK